MKGATVTTHMSDSYGAVLQAYALATYLREQTDCEILHYYPEYLYRAYHTKLRVTDPKSAVLAFFRVSEEVFAPDLPLLGKRAECEVIIWK